MLRPNLDAKHYRKKPQRDVWGNETWARPALIRCAVVNLEALSQASSVRADSSASRGSAEDLVAQSKILLPARLIVAIGDVIEVLGAKVEVTGLHARVNTRGAIDHHEVRGKIRAAL